MNMSKLGYSMIGLLSTLVAAFPVFAEPDEETATKEAAQPAEAALALDATALAAAFDASGVASYRCRLALKDFEKAIADANASAVAQRAKVAEITKTFLKNAMDKARTDGDLERVLVFQKALETVDGEIAGDAEEIVKLRNGRAAQFEKIDKGLVASGITAGNAFHAALEWQKKEITQKGEIETALKIAAFQKQVEEWAKKTKGAGEHVSSRTASEVRHPAAPVRQPVRETQPVEPEAMIVTIDSRSQYGTSIGSVNAGDTIVIQYVDGEWIVHDSNDAASRRAGYKYHSPDQGGGSGGKVIGMGLTLINTANPKNEIVKIPSNTRIYPFRYTVTGNVSGEMSLRADDWGAFVDNAGSVRYSVRIIPASPRAGSTTFGDLDSRKAAYCVIDLSAGSNASFYPVTYLSAPPIGGFNVDAYKTTKLVLKRIEAGSFLMGGSTQTTLSKPFYMGLFEVTQKQWSLVMGGAPSHFFGDKLPVEQVSYNAIRGSAEGANWPASNAVDSDSFLGRLRRRTRLDFDLPTEAQWEYACRAGTTTAYSYGDFENEDYMWYSSNSSSQTHEVGTKKPNNWSLYDMHGNVWEWCLDRYAGSRSGGTDPKGSFSGSHRVLRGGSWNRDAYRCTSSFRSSNTASGRGSENHGFRLARTLNQ